MIELMVALTLGLLIIASLTTIYVNSSFTRNEIEKTSQQTDNGQYALQLISDDLRNAGYLAAFNPVQYGPLNPNQDPLSSPASMKLPVAKPDPCATDLASLTVALPIAVQGYKSSAGLGCITEAVVPSTDVLVVRRASATCAVVGAGCDPVVPGAVYFQASGCASQSELSSGNVSTFYALATDTAALNLHQKDCLAAAPINQYRVHIYYVARNDKPGDGIPTLKRLELTGITNVPGWAVVPLVEGVENLQLEYGIDTATTPTSGSPTVFNANPDTYLGCAPSKCIEYWSNVVAAKVYLLGRNTAPTAGFTDAKRYTLGIKADGTPNTLAAAGDAFRRHVFETVVRLNNPAGRNTP